MLSKQGIQPPKWHLSFLSFDLFCSLKSLLWVLPAVVAHLFTPHKRERLVPSPVSIHSVPGWGQGTPSCLTPSTKESLSQTFIAIDRLPAPKYSIETPRQTLPNCQVPKDDKNSLETSSSYCKTLISLCFAATVKITADQSAIPSNHDCGLGVLRLRLSHLSQNCSLAVPSKTLLWMMEMERHQRTSLQAVGSLATEGMYRHPNAIWICPHLPLRKKWSPLCQEPTFSVVLILKECPARQICFT